MALVGPFSDEFIGAVAARQPRLVYVYDPDATETEKRDHVTVAPLRGDLGVREGAFDVAIIFDLSLLSTDLDAILTHVRHLVGTTGVALIASRNRDVLHTWLSSPYTRTPPTYGELYDVCSLHFAHVRLFGAAPFAAYALAAFAPESEPSIAFDASLVTEPEVPEWFVALVMHKPRALPLEAYEIIQIPRHSVSQALVTDSEAHAVRQAAVESEMLQAETRSGEHAMRAQRLQFEVGRQSDELRVVREQVARAEEESRVARYKAEGLERENQALRADNLSKSHEFDKLRARSIELEATLKDERSRTSHTTEKEVELLAKLQQLTAQHEAEIARVRNEVRAHHGALEREVSELETALNSRGEQLREAQNELTERDAMVRDLVHQLEELQRGVAVAPEGHEGCQLEIRKLQAERAALVGEIQTVQSRQSSVGEHADSLLHQLQAEKSRADTLAQQAAGREATLQSLQWRISELEQVGQVPTESPDVRALQAEIDRLRVQLARA